MGPIRLAITAALAAGIPTRLDTLPETKSVEIYKRFRFLLAGKVGADSPLIRSIDDLERAPDSANQSEGVKEAISKINISTDPLLFSAANALTAAALADLGRSVSKRNNDTEAQRHLDEILGLFVPTLTSPEVAVAFYGAARDLVEQGDHGRARLQLEEAMLALQQREHRDVASKEAVRALCDVAPDVKGGNDAPAAQRRFEELLLLLRPALVESSAATAFFRMERDPSPYDSLLELAKQGDYVRARRQLEVALTVNDRRLRARHAIQHQLNRLAILERVSEKARPTGGPRARRRYPESSAAAHATASVLYDLARMLVRRGDVAEARRRLAEALTLFQRDLDDGLAKVREEARRKAQDNARREAQDNARREAEAVSRRLADEEARWKALLKPFQRYLQESPAIREWERERQTLLDLLRTQQRLYDERNAIERETANILSVSYFQEPERLRELRSREFELAQEERELDGQRHAVIGHFERTPETGREQYFEDLRSHIWRGDHATAAQQLDASAEARTRFEEALQLAENPFSPHLEAPATTVRPVDSPGQDRWISAEVENHDPRAPLRIGEEYTIAFSVTPDLGRLNAAVAFDSARALRPGEELADLTVHVESQDFVVHSTNPQRLRVPRHGKSKNRARFDVEPTRDGTGEITATFFRDNNFIQAMTLRLAVGGAEAAIVNVEAAGRAPDSAFGLEPRAISLFIKGVENAFHVTMSAATAMEVRLPVSPSELNQMVGDVRQALMDIVYLGSTPAGVRVLPRSAPLPAGAIRVYQSGIRIPEDVNQEALRRLARAGFLLYQGLFYSQNDPGAKLLGDRLRELTRSGSLQIQVVSEQFLIPWGILYLADRYDEANLDPELFLGFRHIVEYIPLQRQMAVLDSRITSQPALSVSVNVDTDIDDQRRVEVVGDQLRFWDGLDRGGAARVIVRRTDDEFVTALSQPDLADQILYFFGHASSQQLGEAGGPDGSYLGLTGRRRITLGDLKLRAPVVDMMSSGPLVVINACESAELSPLFYGGFMPYFTAKGARGMVGTECDVPVLFASEWARRFFERFLGGERLGRTLLTLRRELYSQNRNLLGLLYAMYCDGDTRVEPGVRIPVREQR